MSSDEAAPPFFDTGDTMSGKNTDDFSITMEQKYKGHPIKFTQWEAKYVSYLEQDNEHLKKLIGHLRGELNWERDRYIQKITETSES